MPDQHAAPRRAGRASSRGTRRTATPRRERARHLPVEDVAQRRRSDEQHRARAGTRPRRTRAPPPRLSTQPEHGEVVGADAEPREQRAPAASSTPCAPSLAARSLSRARPRRRVGAGTPDRRALTLRAPRLRRARPCRPAPAPSLPVAARRVSAARTSRARAAQHLLVQLGQLARQRDRPLAPHRLEIVEAARRCDAATRTPRSSRGARCSSSSRAPARRRLDRQEPHEREGVGRQPAHLQRRDHRARPRHALDPQPRRRPPPAPADSPDRRCPASPRRSRPRRDSPALEPPQQPGDAARARCARTGSRAGREIPKCSSSRRVWRVSSAATRSTSREDAQRAVRDVLEVADRRRHQVQGASWLEATCCVTRVPERRSCGRPRPKERDGS